MAANLHGFLTDLHMKVSILALGYTESAIDISISHSSLDRQARKRVRKLHLIANQKLLMHELNVFLLKRPKAWIAPAKKHKADFCEEHAHAFG
ncbi:MAG: hypothetical protein LBU32_20595 [Clostridiales bacterium]|nr:hypothetical protein [Clostridiales bacterium]